MVADDGVIYTKEGIAYEKRTRDKCTIKGVKTPAFQMSLCDWSILYLNVLICLTW